MTVTITFQPPARVEAGPSSAAHERSLENVPLAAAQQMTEDFEAYQKSPSEDRRHELYTYSKETSPSSEKEALVALDFEEVLTLEVADIEPTAPQ